MNRLLLSACLLSVLTVCQAEIKVGPWTRLFKGIDHSVSQMIPDGVDPDRQVVQALRVDLTDPDIRAQISTL